MAWTSVHANFGSANQRCFTDGIAIYGIWDLGSFSYRKYEPLNGDAVTILGTGIEVGQTTAWGDPSDKPFIFKGRVYNFKNEARVQPNLAAAVYRWDGGTSWTLLEAINDTSVNNDPLVDFTATIKVSPTLYYTKDIIVIIVGIEEFLGSQDDIYIRYSTDGLTWTTAIINPLTTQSLTPFDQNYHAQSVGIFERLIMATNDIYEWQVDNLVEIKTNIGTDLLDVADNQYLWKANSTRTTYQFSTDGITYLTPADTSITPISTNASKSIGVKFVSGSPNELFLKLWDPSANDWHSSTESILLSVSGLSCTNFIRLEDGTSFGYVFDGFVENWLQRPTPLGGPGQPDEEDPYTVGQFYYGKGKLIKRSDTPIPGINIDGMEQGGKRFYIGSKVSNDVMTAWSIAPHNDWADITPGLGNSGIKSFSSTPWADGEDIDGDKEEDSFGGGPTGNCA